MTDLLIDSITELRNLSHHLDLVQIDPCLDGLLLEESNELGISWRRVLMDMTKSPSFPNCTTFNTGNTLTYLVYCMEEDVFLEIILDQHEHVQEARILTREHCLYNKDSGTKEANAVRRATAKFTTFVLQWMWRDSENSLIS